MPFEAEVLELKKRSERAAHRAYSWQLVAKDAYKQLSDLRIAAAQMTRALDRLWMRTDDIHQSSVTAGYAGDAGRRRACYKREDVLGGIVEELSDSLIGIREQIADAEEEWIRLRDISDAADELALAAARRFDDAKRERRRYIARQARLPEECLVSDLYVIKISSRRVDQIDVYYHVPGKLPLDEGHGHVWLTLAGAYKGSRPPRTEKELRRESPRPGSWIRARGTYAVPVAA